MDCVLLYLKSSYAFSTLLSLDKCLLTEWINRQEFTFIYMCVVLLEKHDLWDRQYCILEHKKTPSWNNLKPFYIPGNLNSFVPNSFYYHICFRNNATSLTQILSTITIRFYLLHEPFPIYQIRSFELSIEFYLYFDYTLFSLSYYFIYLVYLHTYSCVFFIVLDW